MIQVIGSEEADYQFHSSSSSSVSLAGSLGGRASEELTILGTKIAPSKSVSGSSPRREAGRDEGPVDRGEDFAGVEDLGWVGEDKAENIEEETSCKSDRRLHCFDDLAT